MSFSFKKEFFWLLFLGVILLEILSFYGYLWPVLNSIVYIILLFAVFYISLKDISLGLLAVWLELLIGSQGYLFSLNLSGWSLSLRIGLWLVVMSVGLVWFIKNPRKLIDRILVFKGLSINYLLLALAVTWGAVNGFINHNGFNNIFFDVNGWFYWLLILPWLMFEKKYLNYLWNIFIVGVSLIFIKTVLLLYLFSHNFTTLVPSLYLWLRDFKIGEITYVSGNFWRIFMQNQSMALLAMFIVIIWLWLNTKTLSESLVRYKSLWLFGLISLTTVILSYSRSFWLGAFGTGLIFVIYLAFKRFNWRNIIGGLMLGFMGLVLSIVFIFIVVNFPIPYVPPTASNLIADRISGVKDEAAGGSRLTLLPPLIDKIKNNTVLGSGFGSTVTYLSKDPRIVASTAGHSGEFTTYAFEWGYLDILLKLGLAGFLIYLFLFYNIYKISLKQNQITQVVSLSLLVLLLANITTPYLNHPLGIGIVVILTSLLVNYETA